MSLTDEYARAERILAAIGDELEGRFKDSETIAEAKTSPLFRSYVDLLRTIQTAQRLEQGKPGGNGRQIVNILALIDNAAIPTPQRLEMLVAAIRDVGNEKAEEAGLVGALCKLVGGDRAQQLLAIEGGTR